LALKFANSFLCRGTRLNFVEPSDVLFSCCDNGIHIDIVHSSSQTRWRVSEEVLFRGRERNRATGMWFCQIYPLQSVVYHNAYIVFNRLYC